MRACVHACAEIDDWHFDGGMEKLNTPPVSHLIYWNANEWPINTTVYLLQLSLLILQLLEVSGGCEDFIYLFSFARQGLKAATER